MNLSLERILFLVTTTILFIRIYFLESAVEDLNKRNYDLLIKLWKREISEKKERQNGN